MRKEMLKAVLAFSNVNSVSLNSNEMFVNLGFANQKSITSITSLYLISTSPFTASSNIEICM